MNSPSSPRLLAATDLSAASQRAAERAAALARSCGGNLTLLHATGGSALDELHHWLGLDGPAEQSLLSQARRQLHEQADELAQRHGGLLIEERLCAGAVLGEVQVAADSLPADLVVVGARGHNSLSKLALGSTAERLLQRSHRPLLVVRSPSDAPYRRLLVPVDFSDWSDATMRLLRRLLPKAHLLLLHAWQVPFEDKLRFAGVDQGTFAHYRHTTRVSATQRLHQLAASHGLGPQDWSPLLVEDEAAHAIVAQAQGCDLIAIGKHGRNAAEDLLLGSVTRQVLAEYSADMLVATVPPPQ